MYSPDSLCGNEGVKVVIKDLEELVLVRFPVWVGLGFFCSEVWGGSGVWV